MSRNIEGKEVLWAAYDDKLATLIKANDEATIDHSTESRDAFDGCVEDCFERLVDIDAWFQVKNAGNACLPTDINAAVKFYLQSYAVATDKYFYLRMIKRGLSAETGDLSVAQQAMRMVLGDDRLVLLVGSFIPDLPSGVYHEEDKALFARHPNRCAAISLSNLSVAYMKMGRHTRALEVAEMATVLCPTYLKGHYRVERALWQLSKCIIDESEPEQRHELSEGNLADLRAKYEKKKDEIKEYTHALPLLPVYVCCAFSVGWVTKFELMFFLQKRFELVCEYIAARKTPSSIALSLSLVPFLGGQRFVCNIQFSHKIAKTLSIVHGAAFILTDLQRADALDEQPHGHASETTMTNLPIVLRKFFDDLRNHGLIADSVLLRQGLLNDKEKVKTIIRSIDPKMTVSSALMVPIWGQL